MCCSSSFFGRESKKPESWRITRPEKSNQRLRIIPSSFESKDPGPGWVFRRSVCTSIFTPLHPSQPGSSAREACSAKSGRVHGGWWNEECLGRFGGEKRPGPQCWILSIISAERQPIWTVQLRASPSCSTLTLEAFASQTAEAGRISTRPHHPHHPHHHHAVD
jgi:hypothetical protein